MAEVDRLRSQLFEQGREDIINLVISLARKIISREIKTDRRAIARSVQAAFKQLGSEVDLYLDGGVSQIGVSSTVLDLTSGEPKVLREGPVKTRDILKLLSTL